MDKDMKPTSQASSPPFSVSSSILVLVLGGPGAGKGTQSKRLVENYNFHHISTGELLRKELAEGTSPHARLIQDRIAEGDVVPTPLIMALVKAEMERALSCSNISNKWCHDGIGRFLFDGFPRDIAQASAIEKEFPTPLLVIHLAAEDGVLQERCLQRGKLTGRSDDVWDIIQKRIEASFRGPGSLVLQKYRTSTPSQFIELDAHLAEDVVWDALQDELNRCGLGVPHTIT